MKTTVIGPGAMGLLFAARLAAAGSDGVTVRLLDHRPGRAKALTQKGILFEGPEGPDQVYVEVSSDPAILAQTDLALVCTKAYDTAAVAATLAEHLPPEARALTLQNGAGNLEILVKHLGAGRVLAGITSEGATLLGPGHVRHAGRGQTHLGQAAGAPDGFTFQVADLLAAAGFSVEVFDRVQDLIWTKLAINAGINALTALLQVPNGALLDLPSAGALLEAAVAETVAVGQSLGVHFLHSDMLLATQEVARRTAANRSSMAQDVAARRRTEVDFINGAVWRMAQEKGLPAPANAHLTLLVKATEESFSLPD
ncbi:MAG: ketopantoate reductase family protein [Deltaproteobacteria bacterium]|nr:ketopantoate reductase family protein [Deltaproteobacteria bacterium]